MTKKEVSPAVSSEWVWDERQSLVDLIRIDLRALEAEEEAWVNTPLWKSPRHDLNLKKRDKLEELVHLALHMPSSYLEENRRMFSDYIE